MFDEVHTTSSAPASRMGLVTDADDESAPIVLVVDNNEMSQRRIAQALRARNLTLIECGDGDKAVDMYAEHEPDLVIMSLDIPSLDGHLAALEIRERDDEARIVFIAPRRLSELAENATYSAGAVAWVEKPPTAATFDDVWPNVLGHIPTAPGIEDLDELYPEEKACDDEQTPDLNLLGLPPLDGLPPLGDLPALGDLPLADLPQVNASSTTPATRGIKRKITKFMVLLFAGLTGGYLWSIFGDIPYL